MIILFTGFQLSHICPEELARIFHEYFIPMTDLVDSALLYLKKSLYVPSCT